MGERSEEESILKRKEKEILKNYQWQMIDSVFYFWQIISVILNDRIEARKIIYICEKANRFLLVEIHMRVKLELKIELKFFIIFSNMIKLG